MNAEDTYDAKCADAAYAEFLKDPQTISSEEMMRKYHIHTKEGTTNTSASTKTAGGLAMQAINQTTSKNAVATYAKLGMGYNHAYATLIGGIRAKPPQGDEFLDEVKREFLALVNGHYFDHGLKYGLREQGQALDFLCSERATKLEILELKDEVSAGEMAHTLYEAYLVPEYS